MISASFRIAMFLVSIVECQTINRRIINDVNFVNIIEFSTINKRIVNNVNLVNVIRFSTINKRFVNDVNFVNIIRFSMINRRVVNDVTFVNIIERATSNEQRNQLCCSKNQIDVFVQNKNAKTRSNEWEKIANQKRMTQHMRFFCRVSVQYW